MNRLSVRLPPSLKERLLAIARLERRTLSAVVIDLLTPGERSARR